MSNLVDGPEDYSPIDTNQSGDVSQTDTIDGPDRLADRKDIICSDEE
jgi:hypothetical protein